MMIEKKLAINILKKVSLIEERPQMMFAGKPKFLQLIDFFYGYIEGISEVSEKRIHNELSIWYNSRVSIQSSLLWSEHIKLNMKNETDDKSSSYLINLFKEYFEQFLTASS
ncbi:hypothetical protein ULMS_08920 [Patiriisocius marinistellae]|uniref:Uncharacterized protein n=1 Tax=Patiriisocius marinistellae TaxID=2494560 RepID=A0A5J4FW69_9FLAO|nr:hypothetical protein [Patiriisocius marinistellae]GEQ85384.1 hypothetical protein ULMS_08920 [Patiriisocius marinistellae]